MAYYIARSDILHQEAKDKRHMNSFFLLFGISRIFKHGLQKQKVQITIQ